MFLFQLNLVITFILFFLVGILVGEGVVVMEGQHRQESLALL